MNVRKIVLDYLIHDGKNCSCFNWNLFPCRYTDWQNCMPGYKHENEFEDYISEKETK